MPVLFLSPHIVLSLETDGHATRARLCDTSGITDGDWKGVTFFSHPQNMEHPELMRISNEYANPPTVTIDPKKIHLQKSKTDSYASL